MKNFTHYFSIVMILAVFGACTSTGNLTNCPNFKSKKKSNSSLAINFKKKKSKKQETIVKQTYDQNETQLTKIIEPLAPISISAITITNEIVANKNVVNLDHYLYEQISKKFNEQFDTDYTTASLKTMIEDKQVSVLEDLGLNNVLEKAKVEPLSKKEIKHIKRAVKAEIKASLIDVNEDDIEDGKAAAAVSYLFLIGLLISILALHEEGNTFSAFHIRQSIGLTVVALILCVIVWIPILGWIAAIVGSLLVFISWIIGLINSLNGSSKPVFFFGKAFQKWFKGFE